MKVLVISDVHSNVWALREVLRAEQGFDLLVCAGDYVDYGIAPKETIALARSVPGAVLVQGNHDKLLTEIYDSGEYRTKKGHDFKWSHDNCLKMDGEDIEFLRTLPIHQSFEADGVRYLVQHQYKSDYSTVECRFLFDQFWAEHAPAAPDGVRRCMIFGHSHRQAVHWLSGDRLWLNPGSVSYRRPDDPEKTAQYAVIENGEISLRQVPYDASAQLAAAKEYLAKDAMMETELQDFFFFFGNAKTSRDPLVRKESSK
ncbi:metallophosphoesterase family protein [Candidatus Allofournierella excrementavium]|uniref:metallophosphoesterase family protein n=1 Tax=Candidatus Allofournierella excrementavium TaxID=2838591 RepID=UPI003AF7A266